MELTAAQRAVVHHPGGRLAVTGGPGTGKTRALVERYLRVVGDGANPASPASRVLVVCPDAAAARRFTAAVLPRLRGGFDALPITSGHGLAYDVLTRSGRTVRVLGRAEQRAVVRHLLGTESPEDWPSLGHLLQRPGFADEVTTALDHVGEPGPEAPGGRQAELVRFARRYRAALEADRSLDAAGLLREATALAPAHAARFDHVLVDDADRLYPSAAALVLAVSGHEASVTAVNPSGWDGDFEEIWLSAGFRVAPPGRLVRCGHPSVEAEAVAGELLAAHHDGVPWSAMAVLVRRLGRRARAIGRALARHGVPVVPVPALALDEPAVRAVVDLLRWVDGDEVAFDRLLVSPLARLDPLTVRSVRRDRLGEADARVAHLVQLRDHLAARLAAGDTPADLAYEAWARGLVDVGETGLGAVEDRALDALVSFADGLARGGDRHLAWGLREALDAWDDGGLEPARWRADASVGGEAVTIASIDAAAGREWHTVVVAGCVEGELPRSRARAPVFDVVGVRPRGLDEERRLFELAATRATGSLTATAAPEPGVLLSRFVEAWPEAPARLPLAPGQRPPARAATAGTTPVWPEGRLTLSATQLDTYDDCPLRYAYQYGLRARDEPGVHAGLGSLVHQALAEFLDPAGTQPRTLDGLMAVADRVWRDDVARYRPQVEEARRDFVTMLKAWWEQEGGSAEAAPDVVAVECRFDIEVGAHRLVGSIDRVDRVDGGLRVVDYKTGKREPSPADVAEDLQLAVYHLAATRDVELARHGLPVQLQLRYLRSMRTHHQPVADDHAERTEERVLSVAARILAEEFEPAVDANCRTCSFHRLCPLQDAGRHVGEAVPWSS